MTTPIVITSPTPPDLRLLRPDLSDHVAFAISRALAKNPQERYQSAGEFASALL